MLGARKRMYEKHKAENDIYICALQKHRTAQSSSLSAALCTALPPTHAPLNILAALSWKSNNGRNLRLDLHGKFVQNQSKINPNSCSVPVVCQQDSQHTPSLSQPTGKDSYLSKAETVRSQLLNIISLLLSRMFHSPSSGKEESTSKEDINLPLSGNGLRQCFLWELPPLPPPSLFSIGFSLLSHLHSLLRNRSFMSSHKNFHLEPGTCFLHPGSHDWESLLLSVSLQCP